MIYISYLLNNSPISGRNRLHVPRLGDRVHLMNVTYRVEYVVWEEDTNTDRVDIHLTEKLKG